MKRILFLTLSAVFIVGIGCSDRRGAIGISPYLLADQSSLAIEEMSPYTWFSSELEPTLKDMAKMVVPSDMYVTSTEYIQSAESKDLVIGAIHPGAVSNSLKIEIKKREGTLPEDQAGEDTVEKTFDVGELIFDKHVATVTTDAGQKIAVGTICRTEIDGSVIDVTAVLEKGEKDSASVVAEDCEKYLTSKAKKPIAPNFKHGLILLKSWIPIAPCEPESVTLGSVAINVKKRMPSSLGSVTTKHECGEDAKATVTISRNKISQFKKLSCEGEIEKIDDKYEVCVTGKVFELNSADFYIKTEGLSTPESFLSILSVLPPTKDVGFDPHK